MGRIWLACCPLERYAEMREELCARDAGACLLRFGAMDDFEGFLTAFPEGETGAALYVEKVDESVECAVGELARTGAARDIVVFARDVDPGHIARVFYAGATEVIAAADSEAPERLNCEVRSERGADARGEGACGGDDGSLEMPRESRGGHPSPDGCEDREAAEDDAPRPRDHADARLGGAGDHIPVSPTNDVECVRGHAEEAARGKEGGAPVVALVSARGGVGKTTLAVEFALCAAKWGLRAAVVDLDLMFGNAAAALGAEEAADIGLLIEAGGSDFDRAVERTAMRIAPGLTAWGPLRAPEQAELMAGPIDRLLASLRGVADIVFVDTSVFWGDAVAMAVASCDRCLVVGSGRDAAPSSSRLVELAERLGVPRTRMTSLYNRMGARGCSEEDAMRFEMGTALRSRMRIVEAGDDMAQAAAFGKLPELFGATNAHVRSVEACVGRLLRELGCPVEEPVEERDERDGATRRRIRLPWGGRTGGRS